MQTQLNAGRLHYADLEAARDRIVAELAALQRQLDAMAGAIQELDALLQGDKNAPDG